MNIHVPNSPSCEALEQFLVLMRKCEIHRVIIRTLNLVDYKRQAFKLLRKVDPVCIDFHVDYEFACKIAINVAFEEMREMCQPIVLGRKKHTYCHPIPRCWRALCGKVDRFVLYRPDEGYSSDS